MPLNPLEIVGGLAIGEGVGGAITDVVQPKLEGFKQEQWSQNAIRPLAAGVAAQLVAQYLQSEGWAAGEAVKTGIGQGRLDALVALMRTAPDVSRAIDLRRRQKISDGDFQHAIEKAALEERYWPAIKELVDERLSPEVIANAIQQGFLADPGLLPGQGGGSPPYDVPTEQVPLDATDEARSSGYNLERLRVLAELSGNPPGPMELLDLWNRGAITQSAVDKGIREGRTKTKWTAALKELRHYLLSPAEAAGLRLRGWITKAQAEQLGALRGASPEVMEYLYLNRGRPAAPGQMATAVARGIDGPDGVPMNQAQFEKGIRESDIRPEWAPMLWGIRFAYPPLFQINRLVQAKAITPAVAVEWAKKDRYAPEVVTALETYWTSVPAANLRDQTVSELGTEYEAGYIDEFDYRAQLTKLGFDAAEVALLVQLGAARLVKAQRDAAVTYFRTLYVKHKIARAEFVQGLANTGLDPSAIDRLMPLYDYERNVTRLELTNAQIRAAFRKNLISRAEALTELEDRGESATDAGIFLDS